MILDTQQTRTQDTTVTADITYFDNFKGTAHVKVTVASKHMINEDEVIVSSDWFIFKQTDNNSVLVWTSDEDASIPADYMTLGKNSQGLLTIIGYNHADYQYQARSIAEAIDYFIAL